MNLQKTFINKTFKKDAPENETLGYIESTKTFLINGVYVDESSLTEAQIRELRSKAKRMQVLNG